MTYHPLLFLLLFGHVIGDFYVRSDKSPSGKGLARYDLCYALVMGAVLFSVMEFSLALVCIFLAVGISHYFISNPDRVKRFAKKPFIAGQLLHIAVIFLVWRIFSDNIAMSAHAAELAENIFSRLSLLFDNPYWTLLGVLVILRPVGKLIESNEIWNFKHDAETNSCKADQNEADQSETEPDPAKIIPNGGIMIGYLERLIVFFLLLNDAIGTIGFVVTAKAVMRFPEILKGETQKNSRVKSTNFRARLRLSKSSEAPKNSRAEYFLIGTLLSMVCVFSVYLLLRLTSNGQ
ncbi:MAG: DUF3307 domain-containing protein [Defluviitaleaceae bacterium]|nr:DUF3307 domain-containing protein [Defluviitaleaceae bacterium]